MAKSRVRLRTIANYTETVKGVPPYTQAETHREDLQSYGFLASVSQRRRKDGTVVYTVRSNIPEDDWRA